MVHIHHTKEWSTLLWLPRVLSILKFKVAGVLDAKAPAGEISLLIGQSLVRDGLGSISHPGTIASRAAGQSHAGLLVSRVSQAFFCVGATPVLQSRNLIFIPITPCHPAQRFDVLIFIGIIVIIPQAARLSKKGASRHYAKNPGSGSFAYLSVVNCIPRPYVSGFSNTGLEMEEKCKTRGLTKTLRSEKA